MQEVARTSPTRPCHCILRDGVASLRRSCGLDEVGPKDEFLNIKSVTADDLLAAHRVRPQLPGSVPKNTGGFGKVNDAAAVFYAMEMMPIHRRMLVINDWLGVEVVWFERPAIALPVAGANARSTQGRRRASLPAEPLKYAAERHGCSPACRW